MITTLNQLNEKEASLKEEFNNEQKKASSIEEQIKVLQAEHQKRIVNMTRIQGAFSLIQDLKNVDDSKPKV